MDNLQQLVSQQNPQWDPNYKLKSPTPNLQRDLYLTLQKQLNSNRLINIISGPRRVGKSFLLHQLADHLLSQKVPPQNILYFQFTTQLNQENIINQILDFFLTKVSPSNSKKYIFFDEIQYVDYWQDQIKSYYDQFSPLKFILTGSTSLFYKQKSKESLLGRFLKFKLNTLNFSEYLRFSQNKIPPLTFDFSKPKSSQQKLYSQYLKYKNSYKNLFRQYLISGQYPEIVNQPTIDHHQYLDNVIDQLINFDIPYIHTQVDRVLFFNLFKILSHDISCEYSINNIAKSLNCDPRTIGEYIKILEEIGIFSSCYNQHFKSMRRKLSGVKKIYTHNSGLSLRINNFDVSHLNDQRVHGFYTENYAFKRLSEIHSHLEYYRLHNREVDFITPNYIFEVKSGLIKDEQKYISLAQSLKRKLVFLTSSDFEIEKLYLKIPIYLL